MNVTDNASLTTSTIRWFNVDNTYPNISITHPFMNGDVDTGINILINGSVNGTGSDILSVMINDSRFILTLDPSGNPSGLFGFQNQTEIPDGDLWIEVNVTDNASLTTFTIRWFDIDNTYPTISITNPSLDGNVITGSSITINGTVNGTGSDVSSIKINDSRFKLTLDPSGSPSGLYGFQNDSYIPDGNVWVEINVTDNASLTISIIRWFNLDNTNPTISITHPASNGDVDTGINILINGTVEGTGSNILSVMINDSRFILTLDPSGYPSGLFGFQNQTDIPDGDLWIEVNVTDNASLTTFMIRWFDIDNILPTISVTHPASNGDVDTGMNILINGSVNGTGSDILSVMINDSRFILTLDPSGNPSGLFGFQNQTDIPDGDLWIQVNVTDNASLTTSTIRWFDIDNTYPTIDITDPASNGDVDTGISILINGTVNGTGSNIISVKINDSRFILTLDPSGNPSGLFGFQNQTDIQDGNVWVEVNITDTANLTTSLIRWFDVDNTEPIISITHPELNGDVDTGINILINGTVEGTGSNILSVMINDSRFLLTLNPSGNPSGLFGFQNQTDIPDGDLWIEVNITDTANLTTSTIRWFDIDNTYPTISITDPASNGILDTGSVISISGLVNGTGTNITSVMINDTRFNLVNDPSDSSSGPYEFQNESYIPDGYIHLIVNVTDSANLTISINRWFYIDNTHPTITIVHPISNGTTDTGSLVTIEGWAGGTGSQISSIQINDSRFNLTVDPSGSYSGAYVFENISEIDLGYLCVVVIINDSVNLNGSIARYFTYIIGPSLTIDDPGINGQLDTGTCIMINGTADGGGIDIDTIWINDSRFLLTTNASGSISGPYGFENVSYIEDGIIAVNISINNTAGLSDHYIRWFIIDNTYPTLSIEDPVSDGDIDTGILLSVSGNVNGTGSLIASVMINDSHFNLVNDPSGNFSGVFIFQNNSFIPDGLICISINVTDYVGLTTNMTRWFYIDNTLPTISITDPASNGDIDTGINILINGSVDGTGSNIVSVMINDSRFKLTLDPSGTPSGLFGFQNQTDIPDGGVWVLVNITDNASLTTSLIRWFILDNAYPTISINHPAADGDVDTGSVISIIGEVDGTYSNITSVMINDTSFDLVNDPSGNLSGSFEFQNKTNIPDGIIWIAVNVTDTAGFTTTSIRWFNIDNTYPTILITDPASNGDVDTGINIIINGTVEGTGSNIISVMINDSRFILTLDPSGNPSGLFGFQNQTDIPDGDVWIEVNVTDSANLTTSIIRWFDVDNTYPTISITHPALNGDIDTGMNILINGTVNGTGSNIVSIKINDSRFVLTLNPSDTPSGSYGFQNYSFIEDGNVWIEVNVTDEAGLTTSTIRWFDVDNINPTISITHPTSNGDVDTGMNILINGTVDGTGSDILSVMINDSRFVLTLNPSGTAFGLYGFQNQTDVLDGDVWIEINVTDSANLTSSIIRWFDVDNTYPNISITDPASNGDVDTGMNILINGTVNGTGSDIISVMINDSRFILTLDPSGNPSGLFGFQNQTDIPDGDVWIEVNVTDSANLTSSIIRWFDVDNTYPNISITHPFMNGDVDTGIDILINGSVNGTGSDIVSVMINDSRFILTLDPSSNPSGLFGFQNQTDIPDGEVWIEVNVTDTANLTISMIRWFDIDNTYPIISITDPASDGDVDTGTNILINGSVNGTGSDIVSIMINDSRFLLTLDPSGNPSGMYGFQNQTDVIDGDVWVEVNITDTANLTTSIIRWFDVDNTYPTISITHPAPNGYVDSGINILVNGSVSGTGSDIISVMINDSRFVLTLNPSGTPSGLYGFQNQTDIPDGFVWLEVNVTDSANLTTSIIRWFDVDNIYPIISITNPISDGDVDTGMNIFINGSVDGTGSNIVSVMINDTDRFTLTLDPSGTPSGLYGFQNYTYIPDGNLSLLLITIDSAGLVSFITRWVVVDNTLPNITVTNPASNGDLDTGNIISISGFANGTGTNIKSVMINDSRFNIVLDPKDSLSGNYEFQNDSFIPDGNVYIKVNITDSANLTISIVRWFYIDNTRPTLTITHPAFNGTTDTGSQVTIEGWASGTGSRILSVQINDSRFTLSFNPAGYYSAAYMFVNISEIDLGYLCVVVNITDSVNLNGSIARYFTYIIGPSLTITDPGINGQLDTGASIMINGTAEGGGIQIGKIWINDTRFNLTTDPSGSISGLYGFENISYISDGIIAVNVTLNNSAGYWDYFIRWFIIDNTYPTISILNPTNNGDLVTGSSITINGDVNGTGSDIFSVMINDSRFDFSQNPSGNPSGSYMISNITDIPDGIIWVRVNVTDSVGLTTAIIRWFNIDNTLPTISITTPSSDGEIISGTSMLINGSVDGTGSDIISVMINDSRFVLTLDPSGTPSGFYGFQNYSFIDDGNVWIEVNVTDEAGFTTSTIRWFDIDNTFPSISITNPSIDGEIDTGTIISIIGFVDATGSNITSVMINDSRFSIFTNPAGSTSGIYEFRNNSFIPDGNINVKVNITDTAGLTSFITRWFDIDNTYPTISTTNPLYNNTIKVGNSYLIEGIVDGTGSLVGQVTINDSRFTILINPSGLPSGSFSFINNSMLADGWVSIQLSVNDSAGLTTHFVIIFRILQNSNNTIQQVFAGRENIMQGTDTQGNTICTIEIYVSSDCNIIINYFTNNPTSNSLNNFISFFEFTIDDPSALINVTIVFYYEESSLQGINEQDLRIFYLNGTIWQEIDATINSSGNYLEWFTTSFSFYAIAMKTISSPQPDDMDWIPILIILLIIIVFGAVISVVTFMFIRRRRADTQRRAQLDKMLPIPNVTVEKRVIKQKKIVPFDDKIKKMESNIEKKLTKPVEPKKEPTRRRIMTVSDEEKIVKKPEIKMPRPKPVSMEIKPKEVIPPQIQIIKPIKEKITPIPTKPVSIEPKIESKEKKSKEVLIQDEITKIKPPPKVKKFKKKKKASSPFGKRRE